MQQVVSCFHATLNDHDENERTQLYRAVLTTDVESVRFLLLQEGILINKSSREYIRREGAADVICWRTPLYRAEKLVASAATNGSLLLDNENSDEDDEVEQLHVSKRNKVAELLRDAGGLAH
jgi:hypothetical protein